MLYLAEMVELGCELLHSHGDPPPDAVVVLDDVISVFVPEAPIMAVSVDTGMPSASIPFLWPVRHRVFVDVLTAFSLDLRDVLRH